MWIWNGYGYLVIVLIFAFGIGTELASETYFADEKYYQTHGWPIAAALMAAGAASWFLGGYLRKRGSRVIVDKATGDALTVSGNDTLFFIPVRSWGPILAAIGIVLLLYRGV